MPHRPCLFKRLYAQATPYVQLAGWVAVLIPALLTIYSLADKAQAFDTRLGTLERSVISTDRRLAVMDGKLDVLIGGKR